MTYIADVIYTKQIGESWTLCDAGGYCVHADGTLAYHPVLFVERPALYPLWEPEEVKK